MTEAARGAREERVVHAWSGPRDIDVDQAAALVDGWLAGGGDPARSPFEPTDDIAWFVRELARDAPGIDWASDAGPGDPSTPIWRQDPPAAPARIVTLSLRSTTPPDAMETIVSLAAKYDLVLFDPAGGRLLRPLDAMAAQASATFWPRGAIQAAIAGLAGAAAAVVAWVASIPIVSGLVMLAGGFMASMAIFTFVHEAIEAGRRRR